MNEIKWCFCGRPAEHRSEQCLHHLGKQKPIKKERRDFRGDSKYRVEMGQHQAKMGR